MKNYDDNSNAPIPFDGWRIVLPNELPPHFFDGAKAIRKAKPEIKWPVAMRKYGQSQDWSEYKESPEYANWKAEPARYVNRVKKYIADQKTTTGKDIRWRDAQNALYDIRRAKQKNIQKTKKIARQANTKQTIKTPKTPTPIVILPTSPAPEAMPIESRIIALPKEIKQQTPTPIVILPTSPAPEAMPIESKIIALPKEIKQQTPTPIVILPTSPASETTMARPELDEQNRTIAIVTPHTQPRQSEKLKQPDSIFILKQSQTAHPIIERSFKPSPIDDRKLISFFDDKDKKIVTLTGFDEATDKTRKLEISADMLQLVKYLFSYCRSFTIQHIYFGNKPSSLFKSLDMRGDSDTRLHHIEINKLLNEITNYNLTKSYQFLLGIKIDIYRQTIQKFTVTRYRDEIYSYEGHTFAFSSTIGNCLQKIVYKIVNDTFEEAKKEEADFKPIGLRITLKLAHYLDTTKVVYIENIDLSLKENEYTVALRILEKLLVAYYFYRFPVISTTNFYGNKNSPIRVHVRNLMQDFYQKNGDFKILGYTNDMLGKRLGNYIFSFYDPPYNVTLPIEVWGTDFKVASVSTVNGGNYIRGTGYEDNLESFNLRRKNIKYPPIFEQGFSVNQPPWGEQGFSINQPHIFFHLHLIAKRKDIHYDGYYMTYLLPLVAHVTTEIGEAVSLTCEKFITKIQTKQFNIELTLGLVAPGEKEAKYKTTAIYIYQTWKHTNFESSCGKVSHALVKLVASRLVALYEFKEWLKHNPIINLPVGTSTIDLSNIYTPITIVGDTRPLAGHSWCHGIAVYSTKTGAGVGTVTLSKSGSDLTIACATTNPDFTGWTVDVDEVLIMDTSKAITKHTIKGIASNTLTLDPAPPTVNAIPAFVALIPRHPITSAVVLSKGQHIIFRGLFFDGITGDDSINAEDRECTVELENSLLYNTISGVTIQNGTVKTDAQTTIASAISSIYAYNNSNVLLYGSLLAKSTDFGLCADSNVSIEGEYLRALDCGIGIYATGCCSSLGIDNCQLHYNSNSGLNVGHCSSIYSRNTRVTHSTWGIAAGQCSFVNAVGYTYASNTYDTGKVETAYITL